MHEEFIKYHVLCAIDNYVCGTLYSAHDWPCIGLVHIALHRHVSKALCCGFAGAHSYLQTGVFSPLEPYWTTVAYVTHH